MPYRRSLPMALAGALTLATSSATPLFAQDKGGGDVPITRLSLAVSDVPGRQSEQAALDLIDTAQTLSGGTITISEPLWGRWEAADLVRSGAVDLAILPTREWSPHGVASLDALEAPFLIGDDALALAVATSDIAPDAMAGLEALGVSGLAMWPEDLRHLFAVEPGGRGFTTPADVRGTRIHVIDGKPGHDLVTTLGGEVYEERVEDDTQTGDTVMDAQSGVLDGMVAGLWGAGLTPDMIDGTVVAGDIVLYPKYQVLVANTESLAELTDEQRSQLDEIAARVREAALARHFTEAELAAGICERGGTVVAAGDAALAEFRIAARPLTEAMAADPVAGDLIARITDLASETPRSAGAGTCQAPNLPAGGVVNEETAASEALLAGYTGSEPLPDGTYRTRMTAADLEAAGADAHFAFINDGVWTMAIDGNEWQLAQDEPVERCSGTQEVVDDIVRFTTGTSRGCGYDYDVLWRLDGEDLSLRLAGLVWSDDPAVFAQEQSFFQTVWTRID